MNHADLLRQLLPTAYAVDASLLGAELAAEGAALDAALVSGDRLVASEPFLFGDSSLLADWERVFAITAPAPTIAGRQALVLAKLRATGGLSLAYFKTLLEVAGYQVLIDEPRGFFAGVQRAGDRIYNPVAVTWFWRVRVRLAGLPIDAATRASLTQWLDDIKPAFSHFLIED